MPVLLEAHPVENSLDCLAPGERPALVGSEEDLPSAPEQSLLWPVFDMLQRIRLLLVDLERPPQSL